MKSIVVMQNNFLHFDNSWFKMQKKDSHSISCLMTSNRELIGNVLRILN